jgi:hypothetical protein
MLHLLGREQSVPLHETITGRQYDTEYAKWRQNDYCYPNEHKNPFAKTFGCASITYEVR